MERAQEKFYQSFKNFYKERKKDFLMDEKLFSGRDWDNAIKERNLRFYYEI